jgi:sarcosine oxidase subunit beta
MGAGVVLLERDLCGSRSSGVNFGGVRRQGRPLSQLPLAQRAHRIWGQLPELLGTDGEYIRSGHFKIARSESDMASLERYRALSSDFDLGLELISAARLRTQCPWLGTRAVGGSLCLEDGQANPRLVSPAFALAAQRAGAQVLERHKVDEVAHDGAFCSWCARRMRRARSKCRRPCCSTARAPGPAPSPPSSARRRRCAAQPVMAVTEPVPHFMDWSLGVEGGGIYCRQVARGNLVLGGGTGLTLGRPRARRPRRHRHARGAGRRAAAHAAPCAHHPHLGRHRGLPARPRTGARPQPHHARPVPRLRLRGRGLPDRPRRRRGAGRTGARRAQRHAHRRLRHRTLRPPARTKHHHLSVPSPAIPT